MYEFGYMYDNLNLLIIIIQITYSIYRYGNKLLMVANQTVRENILIPHYVDPQIKLTIIHYCILEKVGQSRFMGETTVGKYSLYSICSDAHKGFYYW